MDYESALQRERDMYLAQGRKDRAAEVDAELKKLGVTPIEEAADDTAPEKAVARPRKSRSKKTAEEDR